MKMLSSFTHPQDIANLYEFLSSDEHKGRYFFKNDWNFGTIDFHSIFFLLWKSMVSNNWFQSFFKISSFVFIRRKKLIQVCKNLRVSK